MGDVGNATGSRPPLEVLRGDATPEEVAALVTVLAAAAGGGAASEAPRPVSRWAVHDQLARPPAHGPGAWRASGLPR